MANPKLIEAWYRFMAEAVRETSQAQAFFDRYAEGQDPAEWLARWMKQQGAEATPDPEELPDEWLEQWYKMMGVVPRSRYLELLDRYERLRKRLEEAQKKIERLVGAPGAMQPEEAAEEVMNIWKSTLDETLKAQSEWMRAFSGDPSSTSSEEEDADGSETEERK